MNRETSLVECAFTAEQLVLAKRIMACKDFYSIVGTNKDASVRRIRKSYKKLALKLHPDKNHAPGAEDAFKILTNAVAILSDRKSRQHYDDYLYLVEESDGRDDDELWESEESQEDLHRKVSISDMFLFLVLLFSATFLSMELFGSTDFRTHYFSDSFDEDHISNITRRYNNPEAALAVALGPFYILLFFMFN